MADTPVDLDTGVVTLTGTDPMVQIGTEVPMQVGFLLLPGPAPTVTRTLSVVVLDPGNVSLTGLAPSVTISNAPVLGVGTLTLLGPPPDVTFTTSGSPFPGILTLIGTPPDISTSDNSGVVSGIGVVTLVGPRPAVSFTSGARFVFPGPGVLQVRGPSPAIQQSANGVVPGTPASYSDLITSEHRNKPRFKAVVELLVSGMTDGMKVLASMPVLYQFDNAQGEQLDRVGQWVGLSRFVPVVSIGTVELSDTDYRLLLISKVASNQFDGSFEQYQRILSSLFLGYGFRLVAVDNQDMSIDIYVVGAVPTPLQIALMRSGYLPPKPEGVRINSITVVGEHPVFGLDQDNTIISGPDIGAFQ